MAPPRGGLRLLLSIPCTLLLLFVQSSCAQQKLAQPDYGIYLKKDDLLKQVEELVKAHTDTMKIEVRHAHDGEYKADLQVVTLEPGGLSLTHKTKARLLLDFGEHGREFITSEVCLRFLQVVTDPALLEQYVGISRSSRRLKRIQTILKNTVFKILPMENVNGRDLVEHGQLCERKNGRGVDTNRNFDIDWGKKEKDYDPREEFPGKAPHSEPEVQIILAIAKELQPHTWLNVHSGMYALFTPYDHKAGVPNTTDARAALRMLHRIRQISCPQCVVGSGGHSVGYLAHGTGTDYMFEKLGVPMSFTWEIYGDEKASFEDCFKMFNPLGKEEFEQVVTLWVKALLQLIDLLPTHPATWPIFQNAGLDRAADDEQDTPAAAAVAAASDQQQQQQDAAVVSSSQQQWQQPEEQQIDTDSPDTYSSADSDAAHQQQQKDTGQDGSSTAAAAADGGADQRVQVLHRIPPAAEQPVSSSLLGAFHSKRVIPLLVGLVGMGVLLFYATRWVGSGTSNKVKYTRFGD